MRSQVSSCLIPRVDIVFIVKVTASSCASQGRRWGGPRRDVLKQSSKES